MSESNEDACRAGREQNARHDALGRAMELHNRGVIPKVEEVMATARVFEAFLLGKSAKPAV